MLVIHHHYPAAGAAMLCKTVNPIKGLGLGTATGLVRTGAARVRCRFTARLAVGVFVGCTARGVSIHAPTGRHGARGCRRTKPIYGEKPVLGTGYEATQGEMHLVFFCDAIPQAAKQ